MSEPWDRIEAEARGAFHGEGRFPVRAYSCAPSRSPGTAIAALAALVPHGLPATAVRAPELLGHDAVICAVVWAATLGSIAQAPPLVMTVMALALAGPNAA